MRFYKLRAILLISLFFQLFGLYASELDFKREYEIRLQQSPGVYLRELEDTSHVTTTEPLAPLDVDKIKSFIEAHPNLENYRVVFVLPSLSAYREEIKRIQTLLRERGLSDKIESFHWPDGRLEHFINGFPRKQDWEPPLKTEIKEALVATAGGQILSFSLFAYLAMIHEISFMQAISAFSIDTLAVLASFVPLRAWSNYFNRISIGQKLTVGFIYTLTFASGIYAVLNSAHLDETLPLMLRTVVPSALFASLSKTALAAASFLWESSEENLLNLERRRAIRSKALMVVHLLLAPAYIYSLLPQAETLFEMASWNVNAGHLVLGFSGVLGGLAWWKHELIARWSSRKLGQGSLFSQLKNGCKSLLARIRGKQNKDS